MRADFIARVRLIAGVLVLVALALIGRLYGLQIMEGEAFVKRSEGQHIEKSAREFDRGRIFFTPKVGPLIAAATVDAGFTLAIIPDEVEDPGAAYRALSVFVAISEDDFLAKAAKKGDPYEEAAHRVSDEAAKAIRAADVPGARLYREYWRTYPGAGSAAHLIGFVGYGGGDTLSGQYGLERFYEDALVKPAGDPYGNFFADIFSGIKGQLFTEGMRSGADVVTAVEPSVQAFIEDLIARYAREWHPREVGAIVLDPKTGAVIAMAALPAFDPNDFSQADPDSFINPLVERVYEFGSIMKPITMAAGIDSGAITPETTYRDLGYAEYDGARIENFDGKARGVVPMQEVLSQSLNTGIAFIVEKTDTAKVRDYFDAFGIRDASGIDLPNEAQPLADNLDSPRTIEYVTAGFGQGIALSPIGMARSLATLANGGMVPSPHVATELRYPGGISKKLAWAPAERAVSEESAETVTRMLVSVVDTSLRGGTVRTPELSVAAKTGTAQIARPDRKGYYEDRYLHSFFGYFPAYDPRFLVFLYAVAPEGARYSSETWTSHFMESVRFLMTYYDIPPDRATTEP